MARSAATKPKPLPYLRQLLFLAAVVLVLVVLLPQFSTFSYSLDRIAEADKADIVMAGLFVCCAIASSAGAYVWLSFKPVAWRQSLLVQGAGMFVNRLLPAGIGGLGLGADFLYRKGNSGTQAATAVAANNLLSFTGHIAAVVIILLFGDVPDTFRLPHLSVWLLLAITVLAAITLVVSTYSRKWRRAIRQMLATAAAYKKRKVALGKALLCTLGNTACHAAALWLSMQAVGISLPYTAAVVVLAAGVTAASVTPTPGGVVGAEAGLTAGLVAFGVDSTDALAAAISYRLVSYWLPLFPGFVATWLAQRRKLI